MASTSSNTGIEYQNFETYSLVWLDSSINDSKENIQGQKQLRSTINHLLIFEDDQLCFNYIQSVSIDDQIVFIVSGSLGQIIVPKIIHFRQITSIYVYCYNKAVHQQWAQHYTKIKGVFTKLNEMIDQIKSDEHQRNHSKIDESLPMFIIHPNDFNQEKSTSDLNGDFLHSQILIDCLIKMKFNPYDHNELMSLCKQQYKDNNHQLNILEEFQENYSPSQSLWWYTRQSFLYRLLNKALRVQNVDLLYLFRFFIRDIEEQLEQNMCTAPIRVYRAQRMSNAEVQILIDSLGEFIAINSFFSTSLDYQKARSFLSKVDLSNDVEQVFFEIDADPRIENIKPFSDISLSSAYPTEKEVLFMIGSIFQLVDIDRDEDGVLIFRMNLCSLNDHHLKELFRHVQEKRTNRKTDSLDLGNVLYSMGKWDDAEKYYHHYLNELSYNHNDIHRCYDGLGNIRRKKGDYELSLKWYNKSLEIKMQTLKLDDTSIASSHINIGIVYERKREYENALESYKTALEIYKRARGEDHLDIAMCMNNMGNAYKNMHEYSKALELYQKALSIREKHLPSDHVDLGSSHHNIGAIHRRMQHYDLALSHYNLTLKIYNKSCPSKHPSIASTLRNIGLVYEEKKDFEQALSYFEKAATIYRHSLPSTHPDVIQIEKDIRYVLSKLK